MNKKTLLLCMVILFALCTTAKKKTDIVKITVEPKEASIFINNTFAGYGYAEFTRPKKKNEVVIITRVRHKKFMQ